MSASNDNNDWRSNAFRQEMVERIENAVTSSGVPITRTATEMDNVVFSKARSREEYMDFVARLIIFIKETGKEETGPGKAVQQNPTQVGNAGFGDVQQMAQLNQVVLGGVMNQSRMVQMTAGPSMVQPGGSSHSAASSSRNEPVGRMNQMMNEQNFLQQYCPRTRGNKVMAASNDHNDWRSNTFRQEMVERIENAVMTSGAPVPRTATEMENAAFSKARSRDEYMSFVARLIIHIKEMSKKETGPGMADQQNPAQVGNAGFGGVQQMSQLNPMVVGGMMNQTRMVQMTAGPSRMQPGELSHSAASSSRNEPPGRMDQLMNEQNFLQQLQMQNVNSQLQQGQMQNSQTQNAQVQSAQLQDHMGNAQMSGVPTMGGVQMQNAQLDDVQQANGQVCDDQIVPNCSDGSTDDD